MKKLLLVMLFCLPALSQQVLVNCSSNNLAQIYSTSSPSLQTPYTLIQPSSNGALAIFNPSATTICATPTVSSTAPSEYNSLEHCTPATSVAFWQKINQPAGPMNIYLRADGASCTSTTVYVDYW